MTLNCHPEVALDAFRMACVFALRRDWAPWPTTQPWCPEMQAVFVSIVEQLRFEVLALARAGSTRVAA